MILKDIFFKGNTDDVDPQLQEELSTLTMMFQWLTNADAGDAAKQAQKVVLKYAKAELGRQSKVSRSKIEASQKTQAPAPDGKAGNSGEISPSEEQLHRNNWTDELEWSLAGSPPLK